MQFDQLKRREFITLLPSGHEAPTATAFFVRKSSERFRSHTGTNFPEPNYFVRGSGWGAEARLADPIRRGPGGGATHEAAAIKLSAFA
jgi:hypothetical protein